jgi:hypothetical protein
VAEQLAEPDGGDAAAGGRASGGGGGPPGQVPFAQVRLWVGCWSELSSSPLSPHVGSAANAYTPLHSSSQIAADFPGAIARATAEVARICSPPRSLAGSTVTEEPTATLAAAAEGLQRAVVPLLRVRHATHARARQLLGSASQCEATTKALADEAATVQVNEGGGCDWRALGVE